jgi:hypothetical protein
MWRQQFCMLIAVLTPLSCRHPVQAVVGAADGSAGRRVVKTRAEKVKIREAGDPVAVAGAATIGVVMILGGAR